MDIWLFNTVLYVGPAIEAAQFASLTLQGFEGRGHRGWLHFPSAGAASTAEPALLTQECVLCECILTRATGRWTKSALSCGSFETNNSTMPVGPVMTSVSEGSICSFAGPNGFRSA